MNNSIKIFRALAVISLLLTSFNLFAQRSYTVKGTVKDSKNEAVIGAAVVLDGYRTIGAVTDVNGVFTINIPESAKSPVLKVSCIGYADQSVSLGKRSAIDIVLEEDSTQLDEVVVVGYGSMRKSDLTGSVASVKIDDTEAGQSSSFDQLLQGRAAGVDVINSSAAPDAGVSIRIRGVTSLSGSSEPLYVIDGIIMADAATDGSSLIAGEYDEESNSLMGINPQDIASIEVLKDASATAIYGAAGANGVVLITTKQANRDRPVIRFNAGIDLVTPYKTMDVLDFDGYVDMLRNRTDANAKSVLERIFEPDGETLRVTPRNWQKEYINNAVRQRYYVSISGRPKTMSYTLSLGYNRNQGLVMTSGVDQYTGRLRIDKTFFKKFKIGTKVNLAYVNSRSVQGTGSDGSQVSSSLIKSLVVYRPFTTTDPNEMEELDDDEVDTESKSGPDRWLSDAYARRAEYRVTPSIYAEYAFNPVFTLRSAFGADYRMSERTKWKGGTVDRKNGPNAGISNAESYNWNWDNTLMFNKKWNKHALSGTVGISLARKNLNSQSVRAASILQYKLKADNINSEAGTTSYAYSEREDSKVSYFVRAIYNYNDRYVLTATYRVDGSSQFRGRNRYAGFPSAAFAWRLSQEPWFKVPVINMAKIRVGWGMVGNSSLTAYQTYNNYGDLSFGNHTNESGKTVGVYPNTFSNEDLKWETTKQWNIGLDFGMWKGRFTLSFDAYDKVTYDLLQSRNIPLASGFANRWVNEGTIRNRGLEFTVDITPVKTRNFEWGLNGNLSLNRNRLESLGFTVDPQTIYLKQGVPSNLRFYEGQQLGSTYVKDAANIFIEGYPIGLFYGYKTDGVVQQGEIGLPVGPEGDPQQPGQIRYVDMDGNGYIDDNDRTIIGDCNAKFTYGFSTSFRYKQFHLSATFQGAAGRTILNANLAQYTDYGYMSCYNVLKNAYANRWTEERPSNYYLKMGGLSNGERAFVMDRYLEDGSFLRLSNLTLAYDFSFVKKGKNPVLKGLTLAVTGSNLFVATKYSGWTPMVNSFGTNVKRMGVDFGSYPMGRTYCFDLKFTF